MRALFLLLLLSASAFAQSAALASPWDWKPWVGQVAGLCGPGKICNATRFLAGAGTAAAPAYSFAADGNTGLYSSGADEMTFAAAGARSLRMGPGVIYGQSDSSQLNLTTSVGVSLTYAGVGIVIDSGSTRATAGIQTGTTGSGTAFASFPAAAAGNESRILYDSTSDLLRLSNGSSWNALASGFSMAGRGGTGVAAINDTATLGASYSTAPARVSRVTCVYGGGTGGSTGVVVELSAAGADPGFCSCAVGACNGSVGHCACAATIPAGSQVVMQYRKTLLDGGAGSDCATNPTEITCNTN